MTILEFEKPLYDIQTKIDDLKKLSETSGVDMSKEIKNFEKQAENFKQELYSNLTPNEKILIARHSDRPNFLEYVDMMTDDFIEFHGDRHGTDDRAIIGGIAQLGDEKVVIIGTQKGKNTKENLVYNFGMPQPQGYMKALRLFYHANKFGLPIVTLIDTPGAYPGIKAEEIGQGVAIAQNLKEMSKLEVPIVAVITGEGCSGGALGLAVANSVLMLEHAYYTVISPEGCASILFRDANLASKAAEALKITSKDLLDMKLIDGIVTEPLGGAHHDPNLMAENLKEALLKEIKKLKKLSKEELKSSRYDKFRRMGVFCS